MNEYQTDAAAVIAAVNSAASRFYKQPVVIGYTNGGYAVIRPAYQPDQVVAGGMGNEDSIPPVIVDLLEMRAALVESILALGRDE